jgi:hypothetical protein
MSLVLQRITIQWLEIMKSGKLPNLIPYRFSAGVLSTSSIDIVQHFLRGCLLFTITGFCYLIKLVTNPILFKVVVIVFPFY